MELQRYFQWWDTWMDASGDSLSVGQAEFIASVLSDLAHDPFGLAEKVTSNENFCDSMMDVNYALHRLLWRHQDDDRRSPDPLQVVVWNCIYKGSTISIGWEWPPRWRWVIYIENYWALRVGKAHIIVTSDEVSLRTQRHKQKIISLMEQWATLEDIIESISVESGSVWYPLSSKW